MFNRFLKKSSFSAFDLCKQFNIQIRNLTVSNAAAQVKLIKAINNEFQNHPRRNEALEFIQSEKIQNKDLLRRFLMSGRLEMPTGEEVRNCVEKAASETEERREIYQKVRDALGWVEFEPLKNAVEEVLRQMKSPRETKTMVSPKPSPVHSSLHSIQISDRFQTARMLPSMINSEELKEKARIATGGRIVTRFPPEPNGYLHLGHAKAMQLSFSVAEQEKGYTILRMDDTNPDNEQQEYIDSIIDSVQWLGYKPEMLTHASDYFQDMYDLACKLIKEGKAYIDFQDQKTILRQREAMIDSPYRSMSPEDTLFHFEKMRRGEYKEGEAVLRLKCDMKHPLFVMRDMIAYRIKFTPHPRTGTTWKVYPTYDFTHCICDALEYVTYSLCTLEFENRRESYYWLLESLDLYRPHVWEFSRLNLSNTIVSKRKLQKLINLGVVSGWDDPRLITLQALRRRGYTPESIRNFCNSIGVTRNAQQISLKLLEHCVRMDLDKKVERRFAILQPVKVTIDNFDQVLQSLQENETVLQRKNSKTVIDRITGNCIYVYIPNHPHDSSKGKRLVPLCKTLYIDRNDYRMEDIDDYYGLAPGKTVHLRYAFNITWSHMSYDQNGVPTLHVHMDIYNKEKCKGNIHWLSQNERGEDPPSAEVRHYENLFLSDNVPMESEEATLSDVNPHSRVIFSNVLLDWYIKEQQPGTYQKYQFERLGFYSVDPDTKENHYVFNRVVPLRESKELANLKNVGT